MHNLLVWRKRHEGNLLSEPLVLYKKGTVVFQFVVDFIREALIGLLFDFSFDTVVVDFVFNALPIHEIKLKDCQMTKWVTFGRY